METVDSCNGSEVRGGVVIPQQTIDDSTNKKKKAKKTLAQLPVYRDASNLKYILAKVKKQQYWLDKEIITNN